MILEAFAKYLHAADSEISAPDILARWLWERLSIPAETTTDQVLHCELKLQLTSDPRKHILSLKLVDKGRRKPLTYVFRGASVSGCQLLKSLYEYSLSYEQQKWARFVHTLKASDFNCYLNKSE
jgi:hypothetical protein